MASEKDKSRNRGGRPRREDADQKMANLLDTAAEVFIKHGYAGSSIERIAALAKVGKPTIYSRCENKANLFRMVVLRKLQNLEISDRLGAKTAIGRLKEQLAHIISECTRPEFIGLFRLYLSEARAFPEIFATFDATMETESKQLIIDCLQAEEIGPLRIPAEDVAYTLLELAGMVVMQCAVQPDDRVASWDAQAEANRIVDVILFGVLENPAGVSTTADCA